MPLKILKGDRLCCMQNRKQKQGNRSLTFLMLRCSFYRIINAGLILIVHLASESSKLVKQITHFLLQGTGNLLST